MKYAKVRSDLEVRRESGAPDSPVIVKDPIARRFYRFTHVQAAVLRRLDGMQDFERIALEASAECGVSVTAPQVETFSANLLSLRLLDHPSVWAALEARPGRRNRFLGNLLSIKIQAVNPDRVLTALERHLQFLFSPAYHLFAAASVLWALSLAVLNVDSLILSMGPLFTVQTVPMILLVAFGVMTIHEFAHGLALKHFGGKVQEMGLLVLYFIPAFYCNVDDAWLLPKRKRMMVTLAGGYAQITLWAWAVILWRVLAEETAASTLLMVVIGFAGIQTVLNFNPLIKLDGYYLLSDFLEIPNLRSRAFAFTRQYFAKLLFGGTSREEKLKTDGGGLVLGIYGVASFAFTAVLLAITPDRVGGWLVREYQAWGIALIATLAFLGVSGSNAGEGKPEAKIPAAPTGKPRKSLRLFVAAFVLLAATLFPWELKVAGEFIIVPNKRVEITPEVQGNLKAIHVDEGSRVHRGDLLAELENLDLANSYEEAKGELAAQRASLDLLIAGTRPEEIARSRSQIDTKRMELVSAQQVEEERRVLHETVAKKEAELKNAKSSYERSKRLFDQGLVARADIERDQTAFDVQQKELEEARGQLNMLQERTDKAKQIKGKELVQAESELMILLAGTRKESIKSVEAQVKKLEEKSAIYARQMEQLKLRSPLDGVVSTPYLHNRIGEFLDRGDTFCEIVSSGYVIVEMPVPEKEIADVKIGLPISIKVRGYPHRSFEARVKSISPVAIDKGNEKRVAVQGELENVDASLKAGMSGVGKIRCGKRMILDLLTRRAIRWLRTEFWEYLP